MAKYLVVAHQTVTNPMLIDQLKKISVEDQAAEFTLLVPATPVRHLPFRRGTEQEATTIARELAEQARKVFEANQLRTVDALVGSESPQEAVDNEVRDNPGYAGFVISTLAQEKSRWLKMDLPTKVESKHGLPVYLLTAPLNFFASEMP